MRNRLLLPLALTALAALPLALPATTGAVKLPKGFKTPKVTQYPVTIDAVGYLEHRWTWDTTAPCQPGYAKTIEETLTFEMGSPRAAKLTVVNGKAILFPVTGGEAAVQTELSGWRTTNFCPPDKPVTPPTEPVCKKKLRSKTMIALSPTLEDFGNELESLAHGTTVTVVRAKPTPQNVGCLENRPEIATERSKVNAWATDPYVGVSGPLGATDLQFRKLRVGQTLKRTVPISGGCGKVSFGGAGASAISPNIRSCTIRGKVVVMVKRTGAGFGT